MNLKQDRKETGRFQEKKKNGNSKRRKTKVKGYDNNMIET